MGGGGGGGWVVSRKFFDTDHHIPSFVIIVDEIELCVFRLVEMSPNIHKLGWIPLVGCLHMLVRLFSCDHGLITGLCMQPLKTIQHFPILLMNILLISPLFNHRTL